MKAPRILPLIGVAAAGVLAINALAGARELPDLLTGAKAFAEGAAKPEKSAKDKAAPTGQAADAAAKAAAVPAPKPAKPVCAPTAAELAKEAGLSPAELQVLQSLGARRGQLDQRESDLDTQLALMAAAEAKLDAKVKALNSLKAEIQGLLTVADQKQGPEVDRLVKVFESMKPKEAAPRFVLLDDSVRLPIAAKMKERVLSAMLAQMPPAEAKKLTEGLAARFINAKAKAESAQAAAAKAANGVSAAPGTPAPQASVDPIEPAAKAKPPARKAPAKQASKKPAPRKAAPESAQAKAAPAKPAPAAPAAAEPPAAPAAG